MSNLNPQQSQAVHYIDTPLLVLAGAGSGKTRVITQKIVYLMQTCGINPRHIIAVTFTNKAAKEMKERVNTLLAGQKNRGLMISTFHQLGLALIRQELTSLGLKSGFSIFDTHDAITLLKNLLPDTDTKLLEQLQHKISQWKNDLIEPKQAILLAQNEIEECAAKVYIDYNRHLRAYNAVDFDDLIGLPVTLLRTHSEIKERWQNKVRYLLVDEYQDTNTAQYEFIKLITGARGAFTVVGDDDQSVYAWRGAKPENLALLQQDYPQLKIIKLEQNYRSVARILKSANQLISHNTHLFEKKLWSNLGFGDPIRVIATKDEEDEAERVVTELISHRFKHQTQYQDYAILYRSNHQSRNFEKALRHFRIPYALSGGTSFFARTEIKDIMAYLKLMVNTQDDNAFLRIINAPRRGIGPSTLEALGHYAAQREISLFDATFEMGLHQFLPDTAIEKLQQFTHWLNLVSDNAIRGNTIEVINDMVKTIGYETWLFDNSSNPTAAEKRMANVYELLAWLKRMLENDDGKEVTLEEVINKMILIDMLEQQNENEIRDQVQLMTFHAAKGLEFPHVFLVGMEEEILPHRTNIEEDQIEEERRLAYVGITRAKRSLTITFTNQRKRFGELNTNEPSRFLMELPQEDLEWEGYKFVSNPEKSEKRAEDYLASLRHLLNNTTST
ncbi:MAG: ATP-dependent DNA helicase Rep [Legionellaceae bacterium]